MATVRVELEVSFHQMLTSILKLNCWRSMVKVSSFHSVVSCVRLLYIHVSLIYLFQNRLMLSLRRVLCFEIKVLKPNFDEAFESVHNGVI